MVWLPLEFFLSLEKGQTYPTQLAIADILRESGNDASLTDWPLEALSGATRAVAATDQAMSFYHWQAPPAAAEPNPEPAEPPLTIVAVDELRQWCEQLCRAADMPPGDSDTLCGLLVQQEMVQ